MCVLLNRRRVISRCTGGLWFTQPAPSCSGVGGQTCPTFTASPSLSSTIILATIRFVNSIYLTLCFHISTDMNSCLKGDSLVRLPRHLSSSRKVQVGQMLVWLVQTLSLSLLCHLINNSPLGGQ